MPPAEPVCLKSLRAGRGCGENSSSVRSTGKSNRGDGVWGMGCGGVKKSGVSKEKPRPISALQDWPWFAFVVGFLFFFSLKKVDKLLSQMFGPFLLIFFFFVFQETWGELAQSS